MRERSKLDFVDAMRGIAVLMVLAVHTGARVDGLSLVANGLTKYCQMGVQLFFVASAYTLCLSHDRHFGEKKPNISFFIRRYFRIAPLYYLAIPIYLVSSLANQLAKKAAHLTIEPYNFVNVLSNILFLHGFVPSANNVIVQGGWSIGTEMAFYAIFPILFTFVYKPCADRPIRLGMIVFATAGANVLLQLAIARTTPYSISIGNFLYYNLVNQLPVFMIGFLAYATARPSSGLMRRSTSFLFFLVFTAVALACWRQRHPFYFSVIPAISALSFLFLLQFLRNFQLENSLIVKIGRVSYSMYIFHFIFAWGILPQVAKRVASHIMPDLLLILSYITVCALTYPVALFTQKHIELRGIRLGNELIQKIKAA